MYCHLSARPIPPCDSRLPADIRFPDRYPTWLILIPIGRALGDEGANVAEGTARINPDVVLCSLSRSQKNLSSPPWYGGIR
jgi:hypothetical protein